MDQRNLAYRTALRFKAFDPVAALPIRYALTPLGASYCSMPKFRGLNAANQSEATFGFFC